MAVKRGREEDSEGDERVMAMPRDADAVDERLAGVEEHLLCGLCFGVSYEPPALSCGHTFCKSCLRQSLQLWSPTRCPTCRRTFNADDLALRVHAPLWNIIQTLFPHQMQQRRREYEAPAPASAPPAAAVPGTPPPATRRRLTARMAIDYNNMPRYRLANPNTNPTVPIPASS